MEYVVAGITAFYMFRIYFSIFWGKDTHYHHTPHEAPATMTIPLIILAFGSAFAGFIPFNKLVTSDGKLLKPKLNCCCNSFCSYRFAWNRNSLCYVQEKEHIYLTGWHLRLNIAISGLIINFILMNYISLLQRRSFSDIFPHPVAWFDRHVVDGTMNSIASVTQGVSFRIREFQSGQLQKYAFVFISGAICLQYYLFTCGNNY